MEEIRRTKIKEAMKETLNVYEKLDLNMTEIEIVSRSQNVAAKVTIAKKQLETEAEERLEEQQTPMKIKIIKWMRNLLNISNYPVNYQFNPKIIPMIERIKARVATTLL